MSVISVYVDKDAPVVKVVAILRPISGASISAIRAAVANSAPVYQRELFLNDYAEVADRLRQIVKMTQREGIGIRVTEFDDEISEQTLLNILAGSDSYR